VPVASRPGRPESVCLGRRKVKKRPTEPINRVAGIEKVSCQKGRKRKKTSCSQRKWMCKPLGDLSKTRGEKRMREDQQKLGDAIFCWLKRVGRGGKKRA